MLFTPVLQGITKGLAEASGNEMAANDIANQQAQQRAQQQLDLKQKLAPLTQASAGLQQQITNLTDPSTGKPYAGQEDRHAELVDQLANVIGRTRMILHPPPAEDPHGIGYLAHVATDKLHITNDAAQRAREAHAAQVNQYYQNLNNQSQADAQNLVTGRGNPLTPTQQTTAAQIHAGLTPKAVAPKAPTETADTRNRADFLKYQQDHPEYRGTEQQWLSEQRNLGTKQNLPLQFDSKTGQVVDPRTGTRYTLGDEDLPMDVQKVFSSQLRTQKANQDFQQKLANIRAAAYSQARWNQPLQVLDTTNGNAPGYATFNQMRDNPGRFVPASTGGKALTQQNLMYDLHDNSQRVRSVIQKMPEFDNEMKAKLAFALKSEDPGAIRAVLNSSAVGSLTPEQQDFLIGINQLYENALSMRSVLQSGQGAQDVRNAIHNTLPGILSPDKGFALKQLDAFDATLDRLHRGIPDVPLNQNASFQEGPKTKKLRGMQGGSESAPASTGKRVSLAKARNLPQYQGKTDAQITADAKALGYQVVP